MMFALQDEGEVQVPEPSASNVAAITEMGFSAPLARKALVLTRDNLQVTCYQSSNNQTFYWRGCFQWGFGSCAVKTLSSKVL
jgi:hypothetical protein